MKYVYYLARLRRQKHTEFLRKISGYIQSNNIPVDFIQLRQSEYAILDGPRGGVVGSQDILLLDNYVFFRFSNTLHDDVRYEYLIKMRKGLSGIIRFVIVAGVFTSVPTHDMDNLRRLMRRTKYTKKFAQPKIDVGDCVRILAGRYVGFFGYVIKPAVNPIMHQRLRTVALSSNVVVNISKMFLEKY